MHLLVLAALKILAGTGVNLDAFALLNEQRNLYHGTGFNLCRLQRVGCSVALEAGIGFNDLKLYKHCLLYTSDAADEL